MNFCRALSLLLTLSCSPICFSAALCGGYKLTIGMDGLTRVNGEKVTSQKITFLKQENDWDQVKFDMGLMPARDGNNYGFEFVKRNGKAFLNVQLIQFGMDSPQIIGSFPCKRVPN